MNPREIGKLIVSILVCQAAGIIGSLVTTANIPTWYASLNKPFFTPPNWLFGPVWITLYTLMGISLFLIIRDGWHQPEKRRGLYFFGAQLFLNSLWSILFFGLQSPLLGVMGIIPMWILILLTILEFRKTNRTAAWLLVPYICWVTIATALNIGVWLLNP
jgi:benzodiazapine receptor